MDLEQSYKSDLKKEVEGVPTDFGGGTVINIAAWGNERFQRKLEEVMKPYQFQIEQGTMPAEVNRAIMDEVIGETIVTGWTDLKVKGEVVEYSPKKATEILGIPEYHTFRQAIVTASREQSAYKVKAVAAKAKN